MKTPSYSNQLIFWISLKAFLVISAILYARIGLGPDEAQYWTWSQLLDWGYYSKPPGIAWQIKLGTLIFGNTEIGVRILSVVIGSLQAYAVYILAVRSELQPRTAFWAGIIMAFSPIGLIGSFLAITDGGLVLCWTCACCTLIAGLRSGKQPNCLVMGLWVMLGALFKWPMYVFWLFYLVFWRLYFPAQSFKKIIQGIALSLVGLLPSLWWNVSHEWATFRHVFATVQGGSTQRALGNFPEFVGAQALLLSPILFILLLLALKGCWKNRYRLSIFIQILSIMCGSLLFFGSLISLVQKIQGNWIDFIYPSAIVLVAWYTLEANNSLNKVMKYGLSLSLLLVGGILFFKSDALKHNMGWENLAAGLQEKGYDPNKHYLIADKYQTTSILSFYAPQQKRAYFLNLQTMRKNQFAYWSSFDLDHYGKVGFFVSIENSRHLVKEIKKKKLFYLEKLQNYFNEVEFVGVIPLTYKGITINKAAVVYRCKNSKNQHQTNVDLY